MICPRCKKGRRIDTSYVLNGAIYADGYCSWCGRLWLLPLPEIPPTPADPIGAPPEEDLDERL